VVETLLAPLDRVRGAILARAAAVPSLRAWLAPRDRRVVALATVGILVAFTLSVVAPAALYALSPIVVGVPHLASDARYLVLRADHPRRVVVALAAWCAALLAVRGAELAGAPVAVTARAELALAAAGVLALTAVAARHPAARRGRAALVAAATLVLLAIALVDPALTRVVVAHAHNLVAVLLWVLLFRRRAGNPRLVALPLALLAVAVAVILSGATFGPMIDLGAHEALGVNLLAVADWLAPSLTTTAVPLTLAYVFLQQIHYAVWLGWIPQGETRANGALTFRQSWRALLRDLGAPAVAVTAAAMLALAACATLGPLTMTRDVYLFLTGVHAWLELAALAWLTVVVR